MKVILVIFLFAVFGNLHAQSSFDFKVLSSEHNVIEIYYDGRLGAVADMDTNRLAPFKFISVGKLKKSAAISSGLVYAVLTYKNKQLIIIESTHTTCCEPSDWVSIVDAGSLPFTSTIREHFHSGDGKSFVKELDQCRIYLINVREDNLSLFKWMMTTLEFD